MTGGQKLRTLAHIIRWRLTWAKRDLDFTPALTEGQPKFLTARQAAALIPEGAVVCTAGIAGNHRNSIFFWAVRDRFETTGTPRGLTWITVSGQGGRGKAPGTLEEVGLPGLVTRLISGHSETAKALLRLADAGELELQTISQGILTHLIEAQASGKDTVVSSVGIGTFLDPRTGKGSAVLKGEDLITVEGDRLRYRLPLINVGMLVAPTADLAGNISMAGACTINETRDVARAARKNNGLVLVSVAEVVPQLDDEPFLAADEVDAIVVRPYNEQLATWRQAEHPGSCHLGANVDAVNACETLRFVNDVMGITPRRGPAMMALARLGADRFSRVAKPGAVVNIGVGLPEEVGRLAVAAGLSRDFTFTSESGVYGGLPAPGVFFGAAVNPERFMSSAEMFHHYVDHLDVAVFGMLQADGHGNVNVSHRGARAIEFVGPGGMPDVAFCARAIIFIGTSMSGGKIIITDGEIRITSRGHSKLVNQVDQITFCGREALKQGKLVYYVTDVGVFQLTEQGMTLIEVMPGIDIEHDIVTPSSMPMKIPPDVRVVKRSVVTGEGFTLAWPDQLGRAINIEQTPLRPYLGRPS